MTTTAGEQTAPATNPYVGPRSIRYGEPIFGRDREIRELRDTLVADRIVLLYSPSGAGKSSLIEAGLRPRLEALNFRLLPTIRVASDVAEPFAEYTVRNRYVLSSLLSLEEGRPSERQLPRAELAEITFDAYLERVAEDFEEPVDPCLVFDQFEELFTLDPSDQEAKVEFLREVGAALRNRGRWALFSMREDFIAYLHPHRARIPTRFRTEYRLELLGPEAARAAVREPARMAGVSFTEDAADLLIDNLREVNVQRGTTVTREPGPYVEPVTLQVVCRRLWESLKL